MFEQGDSWHEIDRKWTVASYGSFKKFNGKISCGACLPAGKRSFLEVLFSNQQKDFRFL